MHKNGLKTELIHCKIWLLLKSRKSMTCKKIQRSQISRCTHLQFLCHFQSTFPNLHLCYKHIWVFCYWPVNVSAWRQWSSALVDISGPSRFCSNAMRHWQHCQCFKQVCVWMCVQVGDTQATGRLSLFSSPFSFLSRGKVSDICILPVLF